MSNARIEYADIIDHTHHISTKRPHMSRLNRAAQFSPFAALTGYDDLVRESTRETEALRSLDENMVDEMNDKLVFLFQQDETPLAVFTYFIPDEKKVGGKYIPVSGKVVRYDEYERNITLENGSVINIDDIVQIECSTFDNARDHNQGYITNSI